MMANATDWGQAWNYPELPDCCEREGRLPHAPLFTGPPFISTLTHNSLGGKEQNGVDNVASALPKFLFLAHGLLSFPLSLSDSKLWQTWELDVVINICELTWVWTCVLIKQLVGGNNLSVIMSFERGLEQDNCLWSPATDTQRCLTGSAYFSQPILTDK